MSNPLNSAPPARLVLSDGAVFEGEAIGFEPPDGVTCGEVVFNTVMTGYQEVVSDPSYAGQIIMFTYPHIGNYGTTRADDQAAAPACRGIIVRELARRRSNWRSDEDLDTFLRRHRVAGIAGIDTRRLTRHVRDRGAIPGAFGTAPADRLAVHAAGTSTTDGVDLASSVTTTSAYQVPSTNPAAHRRIVAYDFGVKRAILDRLTELGDVHVVPAGTSADEVLSLEPGGVFLSNGPGDPSAVTYAHEAVSALLGKVPIFGICLGNQILATALGASTFKLPFGHHGGNHPVKRLDNDRVQITSENHNYAIDESSLVDAEVTHRNLNDGVVEGIRSTRVPAFGIQFHPEAGPGPHDSRYHFDQFAELVDAEMPGRRAAD